MVKRLTTLLLCLLPFTLLAQSAEHVADTLKKGADTIAQRDLIDVFRSVFKIKPRGASTQKKKVYFSFLPISSSDGRSGGRALFTSTTAGFYLGDETTTNLSSVTFTPYFNLRGRYGLPIRSNIWTNNNEWNISGDTRILVYPQTTWGLGGNQAAGNKFLVNYKYGRFYQTVLAKIQPYLYAGLGYDLDYYMDIESDGENTLSNFTNYKYGTQTGHDAFSSGITFNLLYDTRKNSINPLPGAYANIVYRFNTKILGSHTDWQSLYIDLRKYISLTNSGPKNVLAFWSYFWTSLTPGTPYLNLPSLGWEPYQRSGRGFVQSRYRSERLAYFETEYRRDITRNGLLGFVLFANVNSVSEPVTKRFVYWHPAGGTGLRFKFNKKSGTNISLDYGISRDFSSLNLNLGETF
ncbi:Surface antigen [Mucilaginibacter pineti]|uniref:Surface antigen n=1 Tax=Mucilaginibacter pineti TaxID=1391627 RepID=A0A1G7BPS0_9SPHI|nr:BamA/TamA family outer membrane protein [Mucilaginibacter pineti]SDE28690.1 Surface antigen [Mucilaginibacter pineti]